MKKVLYQKLEVLYLEPAKLLCVQADDGLSVRVAVLKHISDGKRLPVTFCSVRAQGDRDNRGERTRSMSVWLRSESGPDRFVLSADLVMSDNKFLGLRVSEQLDGPWTQAQRNVGWHENHLSYEIQVQFSLPALAWLQMPC